MEKINQVTMHNIVHEFRGREVTTVVTIDEGKKLLTLHGDISIHVLVDHLNEYFKSRNLPIIIEVTDLIYDFGVWDFHHETISLPHITGGTIKTKRNEWCKISVDGDIAGIYITVDGTNYNKLITSDLNSVLIRRDFLLKTKKYLEMIVCYRDDDAPFPTPLISPAGDSFPIVAMDMALTSKARKNKFEEKQLNEGWFFYL